MRVLLIKTSSMGDIIHTLPALTDARNARPDIQFDWVVEESYAEIPAWHTSVQNVIPIALRRFRKNILAGSTRQGLRAFRKCLTESSYDLILDAQGLVKSALLTYFAKGMRAGLDFHSARESLASFAYQRKHTVNFHQHAIVRMRSLFSLALDYPEPLTPPDFGLQPTVAEKKVHTKQAPYLVFLHGTTWKTKEWPEAYWIQLAELANQAGCQVKIGGGNQAEMDRAMRIAANRPYITVIHSLTISGMRTLLANAAAAIAVDTGFGHLAAAIGIPTVSLYGATHPGYTGAIGNHSIHIASSFPCTPCLKQSCGYQKKFTSEKPPCYTMIPPLRVWTAIKTILQDKKSTTPL